MLPQALPENDLRQYGTLEEIQIIRPMRSNQYKFVEAKDFLDGMPPKCRIFLFATRGLFPLIAEEHTFLTDTYSIGQRGLWSL